MSKWFMLIPVFLPIVAGAVSYLIPFRKNRHRHVFVLTTLVLTAISVWALALHPPKEELVLLPITSELRFSLRLDGAGMLFSCLSATLWPLTAVYAFEYMEKEKHLPVFYSFFVMACGITMGVAMSENILTMYLFYEMLTLFTIPLVMHGMGRRDNYAARKYMLYSIGGAAFAFAGVAYLLTCGANSFAAGGTLGTPADKTMAQVMYLFAFLGFGVKAAVFPFHGWLPTAAVAPTPVTALLHAVAVVKAGAFALIRLTYYAYGTEFLQGTWVQTAVMAVCLFTILFGSVFALKQPHFKRRLAYSTVSNLSYITFAVTLMTPAGLVAAFCHLIAHSIIKIAAFFAVGSVLHHAHREYIAQMDGLGRKMPATFGALAVCGLALTGLPPLCGFVGKWQIGTAALAQGSPLAVAGVVVLLISAFLTAVYMLSPLVRAFFGTPDAEAAGVKEAGWRMLVPMWLCAAACIVLGVAGMWFVNGIEGVLSLC